MVSYNAERRERICEGFSFSSLSNMGSKNSEALLLLLLPFFLSLFLLEKSLAAVSPGALADPGVICNSTRNPDFCKSVLPPGQSGNDLYFYGRFSVARSFTQAKKFSRMVKKQLARRSSLSQLAVRALEDCDLLSGLNINFLSSIAEALNASDTLLDPQAERAQTLLSALLTNQQTCLDGLQLASSAWSLRNELSVPISNDTKLFSLSLALFSRAWIHGKKKQADLDHGFVRGAEFPERRGLVGEDGRLLLSMSRRNREIFESAAGRRLLRSSPPFSKKVLVSKVVIVSNDEKKGNFDTISAAVMSAPNNTDAKSGYYLIYIPTGVYEEYVQVPLNKQYIMMVGDGIGKTIITGNRNVVDGWTTFKSATFGPLLQLIFGFVQNKDSNIEKLTGVIGRGFVAVNMTFRNTAGPAKRQAVAVRNGADQSTFYRCSIEGYQDTLYTHSLRQFYRICDIHGTVDFIFGNAAVVFQDCNIYARLPMNGQNNMITAQSRTDPDQNTGTSIQGCRILASADLARNPNAAKTYLGRPWMLYSRTVVMNSFLDKLIDPAGWTTWVGDFALNTLFYGEYKNTGPRADTAGRVKWPGFHVINATEALNFTVSKLIGGDTWLPVTGVSYLSGLT